MIKIIKMNSNIIQYPYNNFNEYKDTYIRKVCSQNDIEEFNRIWDISILCQSPIGLTKTKKHDISVLEYACEEGDIEMIKEILIKMQTFCSDREIKESIKNSFDSACLSGSYKVCRYIYNLCCTYNIDVYITKTSEEDILRDVVLDDESEILKLLFQLENIKSINLCLDEEKIVNIFNSKYKTNRISHLFLMACRKNLSKIINCILDYNNNIKVHNDLIYDLIINNCLSCADIILKRTNNFKNTEFCNIFNNLIIQNNSIAIDWLIKKELVPEHDKYLVGEALETAFKNKSLKVINYFINNYNNIQKDGFLEIYFDLLTGPLNSHTISVCDKLKYLLKIDLNDDTIYDIEKKSLKNVVIQMKVKSINLIFELRNNFKKKDILDILLNLIKKSTDIIHNDIFKIFDILYLKIEDNVTISEKEHLASVADSNGIKCITDRLLGYLSDNDDEYISDNSIDLSEEGYDLENNDSDDDNDINDINNENIREYYNDILC